MITTSSVAGIVGALGGESGRISSFNELAQSALDRVVRNGLVPSAGVAIYKEGHRFSAFSGNADLEVGIPLGSSSRFDVSCLMKLLVSLAIIYLSTKDALSLDESVTSLIPELNDDSGLRRAMKVFHLISHCSGYQGIDINSASGRWNMNWPDFIALLRRHEHRFPPGSVFNYEHSEHVILGEIIRRITGREPIDLINETILAPLSINIRSEIDSTEQVSDYHRTESAGKFRKISIPRPGKFWRNSLGSGTITLAEIASIGEAIIEQSVPLCDAKVVAYLGACWSKVSKTVSSSRAENLPIAYGACALFSGGLQGHNGSSAGQTFALRWHPNSGAVVVVGVNAWAPDVRDSILHTLVGECIPNDEPKVNKSERRAKKSDVFATFDPATLAGDYYGCHQQTVQIVRQGDLMIGLTVFRGEMKKLFGIHRLANDEYFVESNNPTSVGFFPHPVTLDPCLAIGVHTYMRSVEKSMI